MGTAMTATVSPAEADERDPRVRVTRFAGAFAERRADGGGLWGTAPVCGVTVVVFALDPRDRGGAMGAANCEIIVEAYEHALERRLPIVGLWHSSGAKLQDGVVSLHAAARVFAIMTRASGRVPQISVVLGPAAGGAAYGPALTDVIVMAPRARLFVTGPDVIRSVTGEVIDAESLGGPAQHAGRSGVAHLAAGSEADAYRQAGLLAGLLADRRAVDPALAGDRGFADLLPVPDTAYDVRPVVARLLDGPPLELHGGYAGNVVTALGRLGGGTVGVLASNPAAGGGFLDSAAAEKAARFVRMCDGAGVPLVVLVDVPGYLPGTDQERDGAVRRGAKLLFAFAEASVPRITVIIGKAYGGAYVAMNSRGLGASHVLAWPAAEVAVMAPVAAVRLLNRRELAAVPEPERAAVEEVLARRHAADAGGLAAALDLGVVDEVLDPDHTRHRVAGLLAGAHGRRGEHGNIPL
ncbi:acyl-CoA carboxylase subunit beta [Amycolatopsis sp. NBC_01307]|uniref:carboxyl transferase domain-containing protein n=1 Tax=Amycolatopsis sp. NBC_01307 TaxID=2903561 RepID=UPI002E10EB2D|nr:acyl-CoA carboxylase subunit beta [Amycolatopsis sp. NBC_01307]